MKGFQKTLMMLAVVGGLFPGLVLCNSESLYVSPGSIELERLLAPPPDRNQTKKEIEEILKIQVERSKNDVDAAVADTEISVFRFSTILGTGFKKENMPGVAKFFENVVNNAERIIDPLKETWKRPRPSIIDDRVKPCVKPPSSGSYPSGHSAIGNLMAIILANMLSEKKAEIFNRGWAFARNREIVGVHYPSDIEEGRIAAAVIAAEMFKNNEFKSDFEKAKAEVRKGLGYDRTMK